MSQHNLGKYRLKGGEDMTGMSAKPTKLRSIAYDDAKRLLTIEFPAGGSCEVFGVPPEVYAGLLTAVSQEQYFERNIKLKFRHRHILRV